MSKKWSEFDPAPDIDDDDELVGLKGGNVRFTGAVIKLWIQNFLASTFLAIETAISELNYDVGALTYDYGMLFADKANRAGDTFTGPVIMSDSLSVKDASFYIVDDVDGTKRAMFGAGGITTATDRTYTLPDTSATLAHIGVAPQVFAGAVTFSDTTIVSDTKFKIQDNLDPTKEALFQCATITTATQRTYTLPDISATLAHLGAASQLFGGVIAVPGSATPGQVSISMNGALSTTGFRGNGSTWAWDRLGVCDIQYDPAHMYFRFAAVAGAVYPLPGSLTPYYQDVSTAQTGFLFARLSAGATSAPRSAMMHSRGVTYTDFTAVVSGDSLGEYTFYGSDGTAASLSVSIRAEVNGTVATSSIPGDITFRFTPASTEKFRFLGTGDLAIGGAANIVITSNRAIRFRSLSLASANGLSGLGLGDCFIANDAGGGNGLIIYDGAKFRRNQETGTQRRTTDAAFTWTPIVTAPTQWLDGTLTADRAITLSATNAYDGARVHLIHKATGSAFKYTIAYGAGGGSTFNLPAGNEVELLYDGANSYYDVVSKGAL